MADVEKRRAELLQDIKRKDRRTDNFVKDKQDTVHLVREVDSLDHCSIRGFLLF